MRGLLHADCTGWTNLGRMLHKMFGLTQDRPLILRYLLRRQHGAAELYFSKQFGAASKVVSYRETCLKVKMLFATRPAAVLLHTHKFR